MAEAPTLRAPNLAGAAHGFHYASVQEGDAAALVMPGAPLVRVQQIHSADVVEVGEPWDHDARPRADAMVTAQRGLVLGIVTADCAPVLLVDEAAGIIGAAHAGWRGALAGVVENTVAAMVAMGARGECIRAAIGPCIAQASYEVDAGMRDAFPAEDHGFFAPGRPDHWQFDLEGYVAARLDRAGVRNVTRLGQDTYTQPGRFHSFRRATHRGEPDEVRQFSVIGLSPIGPPIG